LLSAIAGKDGKARLLQRTAFDFLDGSPFSQLANRAATQVQLEIGDGTGFYRRFRSINPLALGRTRHIDV
jgi:hypothetical protein